MSDNISQENSSDVITMEDGDILEQEGILGSVVSGCCASSSFIILLFQ
jgi:coproporphyrinogen III oxidase